MTHRSEPMAQTDGPPAPPAVAGATAPADRVELRVPADPAYLAVLRTATAGLAARLDLTLDEIEDLRIAVDEACALVLGPQALDAASGPGDLELHLDDLPALRGEAPPAPRPTTPSAAPTATATEDHGAAAGPLAGAGDRLGVQPVLRAVFDLDGDGMRVEVSGPARTLPARDSWAWAVLEALVDALSTGEDDEGRLSIRLRHDGPRRGA